MGQTTDDFLSCREAAIRLYGIGSQTVSGNEILEPVLEFIYDGTNRRSINWIILIWTMASLVFSNSS